MISFLGCMRYNSYRLPSVEANDQCDYYAALLDRFNNILKKKRPHLAKKKVLFHQDNAQVHTCPASMVKFNEFLPHPIFVRLALCDYFLFSNLKKWFGGKRFTTREQLIAETEAYFEGLDKSFGRLGELLDQVYRAERRLNWEIKMNRSKKICLLCFSKNLLIYSCSRSVITVNIHQNWFLYFECYLKKLLS